MGKLTSSEILEMTPHDASIFLEEHGNPDPSDFVSAFEKIQDQVPEKCKKCPYLAHFAIDVAIGDETIGSSLEELRNGFYQIDSCPGTDVTIIDGSKTIFKEIVVTTECGRTA